MRGYIGGLSVEFYPSCAGLTRASILEPMPARLFLSSGDLMADRRFDFARDLQLKGDLAAAADLLMQAIELAPNFTSAWFTLGDIREATWRARAAIAAFQKAQASDPGDRHGAGLRLMRLGAEPVSGMPQAYVQALFDQYAPRFEASLVDDLGYRGPALLFKAVLSVRSAAPQAGVLQARHRSRLRHRACCARLRQAGRSFHRHRSVAAHDRAGARHRRSMRSWKSPTCCRVCARRPDASADLILAADAMVYVADLAPVLAEASRVLASGGLLAFTAETHGGEGVVIGQGLRYAHAAAYVRAAIEAAGLKLALLEDLSARNEDNAPVPGLVAVAAKT